MRRSEEKFASDVVKAAALRLAPAIRLARLSHNLTQAAAAERAKMSVATWMKLEKGDVAVSLGSWLAALECVGLLDTLMVAMPAPAAGTPRQRARTSPSATDRYDF